MRKLTGTFVAAAAALWAAPAAVQAAEIWTYWSAGSELGALTALVDVARKEHPDATFTTRTITGQTAEMRQAMQVGFLGGNPPAVYQSGMGTDLKSFADAGRLAAIDDVWAAVGGDARFAKGVKKVVSFGGHVYGVPLTQHVISNVFYNKKLFDKLGLTPPADAAQFRAVAQKLKAAGYQVMANAGGPAWSFYQFYPFLLQEYGVEGYYGLASGKLPIDSPKMRAALQAWTDTYIVNYMPSWAGYKWPEASSRMAAGEVAMFQMGDWLSSYLKDAGWKPGVDYDTFVAPGCGDATVVQMDIMALTSDLDPKLAAAGKAFLTSAANPVGQNAFNLIKGSVAPNLTAPQEPYDAYGKVAFQRLGASAAKDAVLANFKYLVPVELGSEWGNAIAGYAQKPSPEAMNQMLATLEKLRQKLLADGKFLDWTK